MIIDISDKYENSKSMGSCQIDNNGSFEFKNSYILPQLLNTQQPFPFPSSLKYLHFASNLSSNPIPLNNQPSQALPQFQPMQPIQTQPVQHPNQQPQYPLGKKPPLNQKQLKNMRMVLQSITLPQQKTTYFYNIVNKQSGTGFFDNQRLLFLNVQSKAISYLSKIPQGYLPYTKFEEIAANKVKQKVVISELQGFKCTPLKGKISTMVMEWVDKDKKEKKWTLTLGSSKLMNDWFGLVNSVMDGTYDKEKYENMNRINQTSPLTSNQQVTPQKNALNDPQINPQANQQNPPPEKLGYGDQKPYENNSQIKPSPIGYNQQLNNQPLNQPNKNPNQPLSQPNSNPMGALSTSPNNKFGYISPKNQNKNLPLNNSTVPMNSAINAVTPTSPKHITGVNSNNIPASSISNQPNQPEYLPTFQNPQNQKEPTPPNSIHNPAYQNSRPNSIQSPTYQNSNTIPNPLPNTTYHNQPNLSNSIPIPGNQPIAKPQPSYMQGEQLEISRRPKIAKMGESANIPVNPQHQAFANYNTSTPISDNSYREPSQNGHSIKQQSFPSKHNQIQPEESRPLTHNGSEPAVDFVEQLKKKRRNNPEMFVLNNQLSRKDLNDYNHDPSYNQMIHRQPSQKEIRPDEQQIIYGSRQSDNMPIPRQKTNQNIEPLVRNPSTRQFNKDPSRSQFSRNPPANSIIPQSVHENQYPHEQQDYQGYKPTTSWPESTKNLNKIRSDYLERKASNLGPIQNPPSTSKNQHNRLENNFVQAPSEHNSKKPSEHVKKHTDPSFQRLPKFDSSQSRRQDSLNNLNKVNSSYTSSKQKSHPSYNDTWLQTSNPNKKIQIHEQFMKRSRQVVCQIVDQIPVPKSQRELQPVESEEKENLYTFLVENLIVKLHFFSQQESINDTEDNINEDAPVLYDNSSYEEIKREFYNYNLILGVTGNEGRIKVPLCCYIEYRGVLAVVKADIPSSYKQVEPYTYSDQFQALQNMVKVRFMFNTFNCFESQGHRGAEGKFIVLWNLRNLIPGIPNNVKHETSYFRKELLLQYDQILEDLESSSEAHAFTLKHVVPEFIAKLQSLEVHILCSRDLTRQCHRAGLSLFYLPELHKQTNSQYLKKIFMSEIVSSIFTEVIRSQLNHAFAILPAQNMRHSSAEQLNHVVVSCAHVLINEFFSYTQRSESIWKLIVNEASKRYRMIVSKEEVVAGYLLSAIVDKLGLECDFKVKTLLKQKKFFVHQNILPREVLTIFVPRVRQFDMQAICPTYSKCKQMVLSQELTLEGYEQLSTILNLRNRTTDLPEYYRPLIEQLKTFIANFIPYTSEHEYQQLDVYEFMYEQPISYNGAKTAFLAIKWLIKANQVQKANQLFEIKFHELSYWLSEYNTPITEFYDFFSMFYASIGDFDESTCLAKSSLINITKVLGPGALPVADKHYQLGNIYFKVNKKNQALKEYNKTKQILLNHDKTTIPEYGIILLKIALLCLNFGELNECLGNAIEAERIFKNNGGNEHEEIECLEILSRVYEITRKQQEMSSLCQACSKTFNLTQNPKILQRMLKIVLFPKLTQLSSQQQKSLLPLITKLHEHTSPTNPSTYLDSFNLLHRMAAKGLNIKRKLYYYMDNAVVLSEQINRKDLVRKHTSYSQRTSGEAEEMLVVVEAVGNMIGWSFFQGALKDAWYD